MGSFSIECVCVSNSIQNLLKTNNNPCFQRWFVNRERIKFCMVFHMFSGKKNNKSIESSYWESKIVENN
jgi:hypothetical protein